MEAEIPLPHSQNLNIKSYSEPFESSLRTSTLLP